MKNNSGNYFSIYFTIEFAKIGDDYSIFGWKIGVIKFSKFLMIKKKISSKSKIFLQKLY
jgi:hypothetical protein